MTYRYFQAELAALTGRRLFLKSTDKAFFIACLQDTLSPRAHAGSDAAPIDLVAYTLADSHITLLLYARRRQDVEDLTWRLLDRFVSYVNAQKEQPSLPFDAGFRFEMLSDEYAALDRSRHIHSASSDWRVNRYSSIGFYLDDRRGDWVQAWRLAELYGNDSQWYEAFIEQASDDGAFDELEFIET